MNTMNDKVLNARTLTDDEFFYDAEYRSLIKMLDEILENDL